MGIDEIQLGAQHLMSLGYESAFGLGRHVAVRGTGAERWILSSSEGASSEGEVQAEVGGRFELNSVGMIRRLATLDLGIALLAEGIAAQDVADGTLRRVLPQWQASPISVYSLTETRLLPAKTQRFIEFLQERLENA